MASVPSPGAQCVETELDALYERRALVDHLIESLERYAELTGAQAARRPATKVLPMRRSQAK